MADEFLALSECDREPIHIPGSIQPHGVMLVAEAEKLVVRIIGGDAAAMLGISGVNRPLADFIGSANAEAAAHVAKTSARRSFIGTIERADGAHIDIVAHRSGGYAIVELEPKAGPVKSSAQLLGALEAASTALSRATTLASLCEIAAAEFRKLTGYDRIMVYRFLDEGAGTVLAEDRRPDLHSFMNHHFPATDIPQQARALYVRNPLRVIPDVNYVPATLQPVCAESALLDMSDSILRSVSPIHLQYLRNMGVAASASVSIVNDGMLWGLIACHNETPRTISFDSRAACITLAGYLARQIKLQDEADAYRERLRLRSASDDMVGLLSSDVPLEDQIDQHTEKLSRLFTGDGFAVVRSSAVSVTGSCPSAADIKELATWLVTKHAEPVYATSRLSKFYPPAQSFENVASGVLALVLSVEERWLLIWFRAEQIQIVKWAGNPHKDKTLTPDGVLNPRSSFEAWRETVRGRSRRWSLAEVDAGGRFRRDLLELRQSDRLKAMNRQLIETIEEKNSLIEQKQFLIGEVNHRVQNSLQLVSSFLSLQARESDNAEFSAAIDEARQRISAVSLLHRSLYRGDEIGVTDAGRYIEELCENIIASIGQVWKPFFALQLGSVMLPIDRVIPLGLIVTELIININKYAYGGAPGPVDVRLTEHNTTFRLVIADSGVGRTSNRRGFGSRMMKALVSQLGGELDFEDNAPGLRATFSAPLGNKTRADT